MPEVFSSASNSVDVSTPILDQAPGAPNIFGVTTTSSGAIVSVRSPTMDFDGSPLTPNGSGSSGCDNKYLCGALYNADGSNPLDGMGGADAKATYLLAAAATAPGQEDDMTIVLPQLAGNPPMKLVAYVSDGMP